uniref:Secreted LY6/PLAUR domain containing 2 n=1 Tax=Loxodonta africana TaxID=9785 RepID=G3TQF0_LOXAF
MRLLIVLLLTATLSVELAAVHALRCYQCKGFGGCMTKSGCPQSSTHCLSVATRPRNSPVDLPLVTKSCSTGCPDIRALGLGPHVSMACCQASLCNGD